MASGFVPTELAWPSTWTDRLGLDRTPSIPRARAGRSGHRPRLWHEGAVGGTAGVPPHGLVSRRHSGGVRDRRGTQPRAAAGRRRLHGGREPADLGPDRVARTVRARPPPGGAERPRARRGRRSRVDGDATRTRGRRLRSSVRDAPPTVRRCSTSARRSSSTSTTTRWKTSTKSISVFDVIGGDIGKRSAGLIRAGGTLVSIVGPPEGRPADGLAVDFVVESDRAQLSEIVQRVRDGRLRTNIGNVSTLDDAVAAFNPTARIKGKTIIGVRP